jgi:threonine dehydratase
VRTQQIVSLDEIRDAQQRLRDVAVPTPLDLSRALSDICGGPVYVKCENLQRTGSFKIRGAYNRISRLTDEERKAGVVASAGNHAQGVALAASISDTRSTVFMPESASLPKIEATRRYGAEVILVGKDFGEAYAASRKFAEEKGAVFVHPYDHPHVIAGQGTIGLEIYEQLASAGTVVVPIGGGGLISGIAAALKALRPEIRVVGVQAVGAASTALSLDKGEIVTLDSVATIADGIAAMAPGPLTFAHIRELVDEVVTVTDDSIAQALVMCAERMKLVLEPSGAAGVAATTEGKGHLVPPIVVVLSGGNIDPLLLLRVIRFGLSVAGRFFAFRTRIVDRPGELFRLLGLVAESHANIVGVEHHREGMNVHMEEVELMLQVETKGPEHIEELNDALTAHGYVIEPL